MEVESSNVELKMQEFQQWVNSASPAHREGGQWYVKTSFDS